MFHRQALIAIICGAVASGLDPTVAAAAMPAVASPPSHVIIIVQENRTFANLFNGYPGANSRRYGYDSNGNVVNLRAASLQNVRPKLRPVRIIPPSWTNSRKRV